MLQSAMSEGCGAYHQRAVGDGRGDAREFAGRSQQRRGADSRTGLAKGHVIWIHDAQIGESEVGHGARRRADIQWIARGDQHDRERHLIL
jgi:hypothetical protein